MSRRTTKPVARTPQLAALGAMFRAKRMAAGLTLRELAKEVGHDVNLFRWHEAGDRMLRLDHLLLAAKAMKCPVADLIVEEADGRD